MGQADTAIRVLVVDDHALLRDGIAAMLANEPDMVVAGEAGSGEEAIDIFARLRPDVVLMDLQMPGAGGVRAIAQITARWASAKIIVLTTYSGDAQALAALRAGASGYLLKSAIRGDLANAIRAAHGGTRQIDTEVAANIAFHAIAEPLSDRERLVLDKVAVGNSNKQIAAQLGIAEETVKGHMKVIFAKLGVADRTHAVTTALRRGIISL